MTNENPVTIDGDHTRRVLTCVLWRIVSEQTVGERGLSDACYSLGWRAIHPAYALGDDLAEVEYRLARIAIIRRAVRRVQLTELGGRVTLPVSAGQLIDALDECVREIDLGQELLDSLDEAEARDVLACRRAAERLCERLREQGPEPEQTSPMLVWHNEAPGISVPEFDGPLTIRRVRESGTVTRS